MAGRKRTRSKGIELSRLLNGERGLTVDTIERLADYLGLRINIEPKGKTKKGR